MTAEEVAQKLIEHKQLLMEEIVFLIESRSLLSDNLASAARAIEVKNFGKKIFVRGLIEFSNYCRNDCYYCGIRKSNKNVSRYRLSPDQILTACKAGYELGFKTFVLQSGEDSYYTDGLLSEIVSSIKKEFPECAVTLSVGELDSEKYRALRLAGADRFLLRHETADEEHYKKLHPSNMSAANRKSCLFTLRDLGYQVGAGFMVQSPYQTALNLAEDILFLQKLRPHMIGIGPFIHHRDTPFAGFPDGSAELTLYLISILRIMFPSALIPATTALGTIIPDGRERGILSGANVLMPNLSPVGVREKYSLYENKICTGAEAAECIKCLEKRIASIGYEISYDRGDFVDYEQ